MAGYKNGPDHGESKHGRRADLLLGLIVLIVIGLGLLVIFFHGRAV